MSADYRQTGRNIYDYYVVTITVHELSIQTNTQTHIRTSHVRSSIDGAVLGVRMVVPRAHAYASPPASHTSCHGTSPMTHTVTRARLDMSGRLRHTGTCRKYTVGVATSAVNTVTHQSLGHCESLTSSCPQQL